VSSIHQLGFIFFALNSFEEVLLQGSIGIDFGEKFSTRLLPYLNFTLLCVMCGLADG
jgi:hypothetical protein